MTDTCARCERMHHHALRARRAIVGLRSAIHHLDWLTSYFVGQTGSTNKRDAYCFFDLKDTTLSKKSQTACAIAGYTRVNDLLGSGDHVARHMRQINGVGKHTVSEVQAFSEQPSRGILCRGIPTYYISLRGRNLLKKAGLLTLADLLAADLDKLPTTKGTGPKTIDAIKHFVKRTSEDLKKDANKCQ